MSILSSCPGLGQVYYLASPRSTYSTRRYDRFLYRAHRRFPRYAILPARGLFANSEEWIERWPGVCQTLAGAAFFDDGEGWIGRGVWAELQDLAVLGRPIWYLGNQGEIKEWSAVEVQVGDDPNDWVRYARVVVRKLAR